MHKDLQYNTTTTTAAAAAATTTVLWPLYTGCGIKKPLRKIQFLGNHVI